MSRIAQFSPKIMLLFFVLRDYYLIKSSNSDHFSGLELIKTIRCSYNVLFKFWIFPQSFWVISYSNSQCAGPGKAYVTHQRLAKVAQSF